MSRTLKEAKNSIILDINKLFIENNFPLLPIDEDPIQGDLSIICFPGAKTLKKSPEKVAHEVSKILSNIKFVKDIFIVKAFCNIVLDWDNLVMGILKDIKNKSYGRE